MTSQAQSLFEQARQLSASERQELTEMLLDTLLPEPVEADADAETLDALDEAYAQAQRGDIVPDAEITRFFARFHK